MIRKIRPLPRLAVLAVLALAAGVAVAQAAGAGPPPRTIAVLPSVVATEGPRAAIAAGALVAVPATAARAPVEAPPILAAGRGGPLPACAPRGGAPAAAKPPSEALLDAFGILRRERNDDDALPARALRALKARGLVPVDASSARLLRAAGAARAWVVPVPDVTVALSPLCDPRAMRAAGVAREGLAVVSLGGAPAGGGGALRDLVRGIAPAAIDPCAGKDRSMLGVSGIVPDGVEAVFVTSPDGTATRADVHDNGYAFVLPRPRRPEPRHLVWTGQDGTPHVQPLPFLAGMPGRRAACASFLELPRVTPDPYGAGCGAFGPGLITPSRPVLAPPARLAPLPAHPARRPRNLPRPAAPRRRPPPPRVPRRPPPRPALVPMPLTLLDARCAGPPLPLVVPPRPARRPPRAAPRPQPPRRPKGP